MANQGQRDDFQKWIIIAAKTAIISVYLAASYIPSLIINENLLDLEGVRPWNLSFLFFAALWFAIFFLRLMDETHKAVLVRLGKPVHEISQGPYLKYPFLDKVLPFSIEPHEERVGFDE